MSTAQECGAEQDQCPACLTAFDAGPEECPDCGLFLGN